MWLRLVGPPRLSLSPRRIPVLRYLALAQRGSLRASEELAYAYLGRAAMKLTAQGSDVSCGMFDPREQLLGGLG
jgi:hypothetical protein